MAHKKLPPRLANSILARSRNLNDELEWMRPTDFHDHDLPRPIILINGAFDLLHVGHMRVIFAARQKAGLDGTVVCAMDSDRKVAARKGQGRPIQSWIERAAALGYMPINHLVEIDSKEDFDNLIRDLEPDLRVQGYQYLGAQSNYPHIPKLYVREGAIHTTELVKRCQDLIDPSTT